MKEKQNFIKGAILLGISAMVAKFLGLFFRWPVTMLIGDEGIGLYQLAYPVYMFVIGILSGFPIAISSMVSERIALGKRYQAYKVFKYSMIIMIIIGSISSILLYFLSPYLIRILKWRQDAYYSLIAISAAPIFVSIMNSYRGYFQGLQMMIYPAASQIIEQIGRVIIGVTMTYILLPRGISLSAAGASFGACAGAALGILPLIYGFYKRKNCMVPIASGGRNEGALSLIKHLVEIAIPISIGMTVGSIMSLIDSIIVPARLLSAGFSEKAAIELYGQLSGKAHVLINVPLTLSSALGTTLVPAISEVKAQRSIVRIKSRTENSFKITMILALPSAAGLFILADPILNLIFPGKSGGGDVLKILSISILFIVIVQTLVSILQGVGDVKSPVKNLFIGSIIKLAFGYILTGMPLINIKGAAISSIAGYAVAAILNYKDVCRQTYFTFDIDKMFLRPLFSTIIMAIVVYITYNKTIIIWQKSGIATISSIIAGIIIYIFMIILTGSISKDETFGYLRMGQKKK